eukprot:6185879-Pleurochrysis_carterae.AAC.1
MADEVKMMCDVARCMCDESKCTADGASCMRPPYGPDLRGNDYEVVGMHAKSTHRLVSDAGCLKSLVCPFQVRVTDNSVHMVQSLVTRARLSPQIPVRTSCAWAPFPLWLQPLFTSGPSRPDARKPVTPRYHKTV